MITDLSSDVNKYHSILNSDAVKRTSLPVSGAQRHHFFILPGITDEGQFAYGTCLRCERGQNTNNLLWIHGKRVNGANRQKLRLGGMRR